MTSPDAELVGALAALSGSELSTLLLEVASRRAACVQPQRLLASSSEDRFSRPAPGDARVLAALESRLWELLPAVFVGVDLSPVAPLGVCSALAGVDQKRVLTTMRGSEVVSDATNVLALEAARRRRRGPAEVHVAACHRVLRAQQFGPGAGAHFRLLCLVSSARDRGSGTTQAALVQGHLLAWSDVLVALGLGARSRFEYTVFRAGAVAERFLDTVVPSLEAVEVRARPERTGADYYGDLAVKVVVDAPHGPVELGDGGLVDWTATLLNDRKERAFTSCIATERLLDLLA